MAENMASTNDNLPNQDFIQAYSKWAEGGWGALLTGKGNQFTQDLFTISTRTVLYIGNVQLDLNYLGQPGDLAADGYNEKDTKTLDLWRAYADAAQKHGTPAIVQICQAGRQSPRGAGRRGFFAPTIAPSAVPLSIGDGYLAQFIRWLAFGTPREMTVADIEKVVRQFVDAARLMADAGFAGVELHGAHGYLISTLRNNPCRNTQQKLWSANCVSNLIAQFLSPKVRILYHLLYPTTEQLLVS
jgi:2,4-dienoyl-CoA reductase-like NADH-dependent reductase (Old Yellow Enzyme family)